MEIFTLDVEDKEFIMPLKPGKKNIGKNIEELEHSKTKRPHKQIVAIALSEARESGAKIPKPKSKRKKK